MVDTESLICPLSPLEADDLESPLSEEFLQEMGTIQEISQSIGEDSSGSFSFTEYQYLGSGPGSDGSVITGACAVARRALLRNVGSAGTLFSVAGKESHRPATGSSDVRKRPHATGPWSLQVGLASHHVPSFKSYTQIRLLDSQ